MRHGRKIIVGVVFVMLLVVSVVWLLNKTATKIEWCGKYVGNFVDDSEYYKRFTPSIHIEKTSGNYTITMSFRTVYGEAHDDVVGEDFLPVELEQMEERNYILVFEHKLSKATGIEYKLFVELQYDMEDTLNFRYAEKEEELALKDFYKLRKVSE